jgi:hypothetical protein
MRWALERLQRHAPEGTDLEGLRLAAELDVACAVLFARLLDGGDVADKYSRLMAQRIDVLRSLRLLPVRDRARVKSGDDEEYERNMARIDAEEAEWVQRMMKTNPPKGADDAR